MYIVPLWMGYGYQCGLCVGQFCQEIHQLAHICILAAAALEKIR